MVLADVIGTVVCSQVDGQYPGGLPLLLVREVSAEGAKGGSLVAFDLVGAGFGERVLISKGPSARQHDFTRDKPVDAVVAAIVDQVARADKVVFRK